MARADILPRRPKGRMSAAVEAAYQTRLTRFCTLILQIRSSLDFEVGSRGWCYLLEKHGLLKGDFAAAENLIGWCRKSGALPLDICAEDAARVTVGLQKLDEPDVEAEAASWVDHITNHVHKTYLPISFWDGQKVYVEMVVEKLDLRNLFAPTCAEFYVPLASMKGWADINQRVGMMRRFAEHEAAGRRCVLLICGDHDPGGLLISDFMRKNLRDLSLAVGWDPVNLIITRFGLNAEFIDANGLTWLDNLVTSGGLCLSDEHHNDHSNRNVQEYLDRYGVKKCEANALVAQPELGRALCRETIMEYLPRGAVGRYRRKLEIERERLRLAIQATLTPTRT